MSNQPRIGILFTIPSASLFQVHIPEDKCFYLQAYSIKLQTHTAYMNTRNSKTGSQNLKTEINKPQRTASPGLL
jgi:hypothetical protein